VNLLAGIPGPREPNAVETQVLGAPSDLQRAYFGADDVLVFYCPECAERESKTEFRRFLP
jgi:hypothetical protein